MKSPAHGGAHEFLQIVSAWNDAACLHAFWALGGFEFHVLAFGQRFVSIRFDRRVMNKHIGAAVTRGNKAVTLGIIKPLHGTGLHNAQTPPRPPGVRGACPDPPCLVILRSRTSTGFRASYVNSRDVTMQRGRAAVRSGAARRHPTRKLAISNIHSAVTALVHACVRLPPQCEKISRRAAHDRANALYLRRSVCLRAGAFWRRVSDGFSCASSEPH